MRGRCRKLLAVACALLTAAAPALGWGPQGHRVITRIAMSRLTPKAEAAIRELLEPGDTLVDVCDWADHEGHDAVPGSAPWHYVNVPIDAEAYDARDCSKDGCVVTKIVEFRKILADKKSLRRERRRALLFLVHFVEDVHQPLHVGDNHDRGGTRTQIQFHNSATNLHSIWDSGMIHRIGGNDEAWVRRVKPLVTRENVREWSKGSVVDWANESLAVAKKAYTWPVDSKKPIASGATLKDDYVDHFLPAVERRLRRAR